jgi:ABC-type transport system involved in multi-copper enzyme maturation permease subunit
MSAPPVPSLGRAVAAVFRMQATRTLRGKKLRLAIVALGVVLAGALAARYLLRDPDAERLAAAVKNDIDYGFLHLLVYLLPFLFASGSIAEEVEGRTLAYVVARPVSRLALVLGKYLCAVAFVVPLLVGGILLLHAGALVTSPAQLGELLPGTLRAAGATALLACAYVALCMFWGTLAVEAAGIVSTLYLAVVEFGFSLVPGIFRCLSLNYLAQQLAGMDKGGPALFLEITPDVAPAVAGPVLGGATFLFLALAWAATAGNEFRFSRA